VTARVLAWFLCVVAASVSFAADDTTVRELVEAERLAKEVEEQFQAAPQKLRSESPLKAMLIARERVSNNDFAAASEFLDMRYLEEPIASADPGELMRKLVLVWARYSILDLSQLSDEPDGHLDDGLPSYRDLMGVIDTGSEEISLYLQKVPDPQHGHTWKVSNQTVKQIPVLWERYGYNEWAVRLGEYLPDFNLLTLQNWQLASILIILVCGYVLVALIVRVIEASLTRFSPLSAHDVDELFNFAFRAFLYLLVVRTGVQELGLSLKARVIIESAGGLYLIWALFLIGSVDIAQQLNARRLEQRGRAYVIALTKPIAVTTKILIFIVCSLMWAENAGYNMSTIIAGLGVGSVAVALAAQKTFENVIGAFTIYVARPIKPGDFCRFGKFEGTVEEIGLRSTVIRTLDRSLAYIPNSVFAAKEVENLSVRDKIRYRREISIDVGTSADEMRVLLASIRKLFLSHPKVEQDSLQIRFEKVEHSGFKLRVIAYTLTTEFSEYLRIAEDLNLRLLTLFDELSIHLSQERSRVAVIQQGQPDVNTRDSASALVQQWRDEESLPFPDYDDSQRDELRGSLDYPPAGSVLKS